MLMKGTRQSREVPMSQGRPSRSQTCSACRPCDCSRHPFLLSSDI